MESFLNNAVQYLKGVGPRRDKLFERLGVRTVEDLLYYFPWKYYDRRRFTPIATLQEGDSAVIRGKVLSAGLIRTKSRKKLFRLVVGDESGKFPCTWFNQPYLAENFREGDEVIFSGKVQRYQGLQLINPEYEKLVDEEDELIHSGRIVPVYPLTEGLYQKNLREIIKQSLDRYLSLLPDMLPDGLRERWKVVSLGKALGEIHYPTDPASRDEARKRLILDEFFLLQLALLIQKARFSRQEASLPHPGPTPQLDKFLRSLPFKLTRAQKKVIGEIGRDMAAPRPMNRLLQGDVGSGKTVVAVSGLLNTVDNGYQGAIMAPTEILAVQHYQTLLEMVGPLGIETALLTGGVKGAKKKKVLEGVSSGKIKIVVGTQALIQKTVNFQKLGMVVIDEQHKFGVLQRSELRKKGSYPHVLVMTATPIPRSLTLTVYGDLDVSVIDELPPGRKQVKTYWIGPKKLKEAYNFIRSRVEAGEQAFIIYPLVEESEVLEVKSATEMFTRLQANVFPELKLGLIHGRLPAAEKDQVMDEFRAGKVRVLVSTLVVEIGIDIPNATVILVENAERFGLAQLHQLRGRVGRSRSQSYCILQGNPGTEDGRRRLQAMKTIDDGFRIARQDLEIRGPGEFFGTHQTGLTELRIGSIVADVRLMEYARRQAAGLIEEDGGLAKPEHALIREKLLKRYGGRLELGQVG